MKREKGFITPESVGDLWLSITAQPSHPHFAIDPAWPPHGYCPEERRESRPPQREPSYVFPPGHVRAEWCVVCGAAPGKVCRELDPLSFRYRQPRHSHSERYRLADIKLRDYILRETEAAK